MKTIYKKLLLAGMLAIVAAAPVQAGPHALSSIKGVFASSVHTILNTCCPTVYQHWLYTFVYSPGENTRDYKNLEREKLSLDRMARRAVLFPFVIYERCKLALIKVDLKKKRGSKPFVKE